MAVPAHFPLLRTLTRARTARPSRSRPAEARLDTNQFPRFHPNPGPQSALFLVLPPSSADRSPFTSACQHWRFTTSLNAVRFVQNHAYRGGITRSMQRPPAATEGAPLPPPRSKPSALTSIAIPTFASFQSQTSSYPVPIAVQSSPIRRKPLPAESPVIGRFAAAQFETRTSTVQDKDITLPIQGRRRLNTVLSPPLTEDDDLFVPRNLDE